MGKQEVSEVRRGEGKGGKEDVSEEKRRRERKKDRGGKERSAQ